MDSETYETFVLPLEPDQIDKVKPGTEVSYWAIVIWIFGEGLGGIPESGVSLLTGFPGSVLIYIILAGSMYIPIS